MTTCPPAPLLVRSLTHLLGSREGWHTVLLTQELKNRGEFCNMKLLFCIKIYWLEAMIIYFRKIVYNILTFLLTITLILGVSIFTYGTFYFAYMPSEVPRLSLSPLARGVPGARRGCQLPVPALPGQSGAVRLPEHEPQAGHQAAQADGRPALQTLPQPRAAGVLGEPGTGGYR